MSSSSSSVGLLMIVVEGVSVARTWDGWNRVNKAADNEPRAHMSVKNYWRKAYLSSGCEQRVRI